jgi:hypothetical protein
MGTSNKREVAKRLKEEILKTTDPKLMAELTRQLAAISPKTTRRNRKPVEKPQQVLKKNRSLREIYTASRCDEMSDGELVVHHLVLQIETKQKANGTKFTKAERDALIAELKNSLSVTERAAFEGLNEAEVD